MKSTGLNIIMFNMSCHSDWEEGISNRNRHLLQTLLDDPQVNKIIAIDYLPWNYKKVIKQFLYSYLPSLNKGKKLYHANLTSARVYNDKLIVVSSLANYFNKNRFWQDINKIIKKAELDDYLVWSCNPLVTDYFSQLKQASGFIFDAIDDWSIHPAYQKIKDQLEKNYEIIGKESNLIFTVANELKSKFPPTKTYWIPNGIDLNHYQQNFNLTDKEIADIPKPIIGYLGHILGRLDLKTIEYLAKHNPDKSIVLAGAFKGKVKYWDKGLINKLQALPNVYLLGYIPYDKAPMYLQQFSVGIIPHLTDNYVATTNPMKMYEYLACGLPIVASPAPGMDMFPEIKIAETVEGFNGAVNIAIAGDNETARQERQAIVREHTWQNRVEKILELINNSL